MKVILLEDDPVIVVCTEDALIDAGFEVLSANAGEEALALLSANPDVAAVMVDVRLAGALNGWEVAQRARKSQPDMAIVYTTTVLGSEYEESGVDRSVLLQKPYTLDRAVGCIRNALNKVTS